MEHRRVCFCMLSLLPLVQISKLSQANSLLFGKVCCRTPRGVRGLKFGTEYTIEIKKYAEDEAFERRSIDGYCDWLTKKIVVCDMSTYKGWEHETKETISASEKKTLRHEIVHAFFDESGLGSNTFSVDGPWATNEEMVDWIAVQGPKIYKAWQEAGAV